MASDTFYGDFMVKLKLRLAGNLIYHIFSTGIKAPNYLQTNFTIESPEKYYSQYCRHIISILTILVIKFIMFSPQTPKQLVDIARNLYCLPAVPYAMLYFCPVMAFGCGRTCGQKKPFCNLFLRKTAGIVTIKLNTLGWPHFQAAFFIVIGYP